MLFDNYLSKTKNQDINGTHLISNLVTFINGIATPTVVVEGDINGINLGRFIKTVLLNRPQLFEDTVYFEKLSVDRK